MEPLGLIPAHAGKTWSSQLLYARTAAHPRSRGENRAFPGHAQRLAGSSPLTRGKHSDETLSFHPARLIPAHAGKTCAVLLTRSAVAAHPRSRGENMASLLKKAPAIGSSPLTRGKLAAFEATVRVEGLIPAHAGKTPASLTHICMPPAHPRSRGENPGAYVGFTTMKGSSPLTRGKPHLVVVGEAIRRLIPAHAGKTDLRALGAGACAAHPRSRGENIQTCVQVAADLGSSPLTRGKHFSDTHFATIPRLIPAHAGKTIPALMVGEIAGAHPRSRGENANFGDYLQTIEGSSPLTRGKPWRIFRLVRRARLIPAHAGKTSTL